MENWRLYVPHHYQTTMWYPIGVPWNFVVDKNPYRPDTVAGTIVQAMTILLFSGWLSMINKLCTQKLLGATVLVTNSTRGEVGKS